MTCLLGFVGLATDVGTLLNAKRKIQTAADSAAIAGAAELSYGNATYVIAQAKADAVNNGQTDGSNGTTVTVNPPPVGGLHAGNANYVEVIVSQNQPTMFMKIFNLNTVAVSARAVAFLFAQSELRVIALGPGVRRSSGQYHRCEWRHRKRSKRIISVRGCGLILPTSKHRLLFGEYARCQVGWCCR